MSTISVELTPGYQFPTDGSVELTYELLNLLGRPTINLVGAIGTLSLNDGSVTTVKLADNVLEASATGRGKMEDGFFAADATSRAKFSPNFFGAGDATSVAFFEDGFWTVAARPKFADALLAQLAPIVSASRNLIIQNNSGTPNSQVDVDADEIILKNSDGAAYVASAVNLTANLAASGANGLDTGAEAGNTWYYLYVIYDGTTVASLLSVSATAPTLPGSYTYKALIGAVRNNGSSNFETLYQQDRVAWIAESVATTGTAGPGALTALSLATIVPPIAKRVWGTAGTSNDNGSRMTLAGNAAGLATVTLVSAQTGNNTNSFFASAPFEMVMVTAQTIYWDSIAGANHRITISGYAL